MSEPTPPPLPNAVIPSNFNALANAQNTLARSPLERHSDTVDTTRQPIAPGPEAEAYDSAAALAQARAEDLRRAQGQQPEPREAREPAPASDATPSKSGLEFRRPSKSEAKAKRADDWNALKASREDALARVTQLEQEIQSARGGNGQATSNTPVDYSKLPVDQLYSHPDIKKLKEERDTFYEEVKHVRVEADPEFRAKFDSRRDAAIRIAKSVAGGAGDEIAKILTTGDSESRRAALAERLTSGNFSDATKHKIMVAAASLDTLDVEREMEIASRKATWEHTQASRQHQQSQQMNQRIAKLDAEFTTVSKRWADPEKGMPFVMQDPDTIVREARQVFSGEASGEALAEAAMRAAVLPRVLTMAQDAFEEITKLKEQLSRYTGSYPSDDGGGANIPYAPINSGADLYNANYVNDFSHRLEAARSSDRRGR